MNVTPSKILLGLSLAAYTYASWDHLSPTKAAAAAAPVKGPALTSAIVNRGVTLKLERDPFNSVPLGQTLASAAATMPVEPGKDLGELRLSGVLVTLAERAAVINGKTLHEGDTMETPTGARIRAKKIGVGYCTIEGGGALIMLKLDEDKNKSGDAGGTSASVTGGSGGSAPGKPYVAKDKQPQKPGKK